MKHLNRNKRLEGKKAPSELLRLLVAHDFSLLLVLVALTANTTIATSGRIIRRLTATANQKQAILSNVRDYSLPLTQNVLVRNKLGVSLGNGRVQVVQLLDLLFINYTHIIEYNSMECRLKTTE